MDVERRVLPSAKEHPNFAVLTYAMELRRNLVFSSYMLTLPCVFLACLTLVVFWLPPNRPDRTSLGEPSQQTRDIEPMLGQYWADVVDGGLTLTQHWFSVSCLLGYHLNTRQHIIITGQAMLLINLFKHDYGHFSIRLISRLNRSYWE